MAQTPEPMAANAAYVELGGFGGYYSVNYERGFADRWTWRVGASEFAFTNMDGVRVHISAVPLGITRVVSTMTLFEDSDRLFGGAGRWLEFGAGLVAGREGRDRESEPADRVPLMALAGSLGLRMQKPEGGWMLRVALTPFLPIRGIDDDLMFTGVSGGIGVGYAF